MSEPLAEPKQAPSGAYVVVISTSLNPGSRSRILARRFAQLLAETYPDLPSAHFADLQAWEPLPIAGSPQARQQAENHADLQTLKAELARATHVIIAAPIYNFAVGASAKNLVELLVSGKEELANKTVGFLCALGGPRSYMSVLGFANSLMLDFRCWIVPRFVVASGADFTNEEITGGDIEARMEQLATEMFERTVPPPAW